MIPHCFSHECISGWHHLQRWPWALAIKVKANLDTPMSLVYYWEVWRWSIKKKRKRIVGNLTFLLIFHIRCDLNCDLTFTKMKSARAVIGIYHHTTFENGILEARLLTDRQTNRTNSPSRRELGYLEAKYSKMRSGSRFLHRHKLFFLFKPLLCFFLQMDLRMMPQTSPHPLSQSELCFRPPGMTGNEAVMLCGLLKHCWSNVWVGHSQHFDAADRLPVCLLRDLWLMHPPLSCSHCHLNVVFFLSCHGDHMEYFIWKTELCWQAAAR